MNEDTQHKIKFESLIETIDPFNNKQIIFSSCIDVMSNVIILEYRLFILILGDDWY